ncbi:GNAT family N-acetyltransferase [Pseudalkalibacillus decolorationis]|uniref:GNAT family N-acetyltransferase n=1 Tax=Pseudalkalibacillus decolorationis TaxID=163879 RepID=UPI00355891BA
MQKRMDLFEKAVAVFWEQWGNKDNYNFYYDCISHSCKTTDEIPRFYIAVKDERIIGTYAMLRNDLNSRQDLYPWLACLYVDPAYRGQEIGSKLLQHSLFETSKKGFKKLYLTTDLDGYYEKYGWDHLTEAYGVSGESIKVYAKGTE